MFSEELNTEKWNEYFIDGTNVLKNKFGIVDRETLIKKETEVTFQRLTELYVKPIPMNFDEKHLKAIHYYLFNDIYYFAGKYRDVYMEKNNSYFAPVDQIEPRLEEIFGFMNEEVKNISSKYLLLVF